MRVAGRPSPRLPIAVATSLVLLAAATIASPTTIAAPLSTAFAPTADATIRSDKPTQNFGTATTVEVDGSPAKRFLMKFTVSGIGTGTVVSAKLHIFCTN